MPNETMRNIFKLNVTNHGLLATLTCTDINGANALKLTAEDLIKFLKAHNIVCGLEREALNKLTNKLTSADFPLTIAKGERPIDGKDGYIEYNVQTDEKIKISPDEKVNFRDVLRIPTVQKGERLATIVNPTK